MIKEFLMQKVVVKLLVVLAASTLISVAGLACPADSSASWLYYHRPEYNGKVIDAESGAPIEGAVVVAIYYKDTYAVIESISSVIKVREVLSDKEGNFKIPSYTTLIQPFSVDAGVHPQMIFYKPGYASISLKDLEDCFIGECKEKLYPAGHPEEPRLTVRLGTGYIALPPVEGKKQRLEATSAASPGAKLYKKLPMLTNMINAERKKFGLGLIKGL